MYNLWLGGAGDRTRRETVCRRLEGVSGLISDTDEQSLAIWIELQRRRTPGQQIQRALEMTRLVRSMFAANLRQEDPAITEPEIRRRMVAAYYGADIGEAGGGMNEVHSAFRELMTAFQEMELPYAVGGSIASAAHGIARSVQNVDLVVDLRSEEPFTLAGRLAGSFAVDPEAAREAAAANRPFHLIHMGSAMKFDIFPMMYFTHGEDELRRRQMQEGTGLVAEGAVPVVSAEDIILAKLAWYRRGGETSERQWRDVEAVWTMRGPALDWPYLMRWASEMGTMDLLRRLAGGDPS